MLDKEVKSILEEQFSMERNYEKVFKRSEKRRYPYIRVLKLTLVPICVILLAIVILPNMKTENNELKEIVEIAEKGEDIKEDIQVKEKNMIQDGEKDIDAMYDISKDIASQEEVSWAFDPTDIERAIKDNDGVKSIIRVKIEEVQDEIYLPKMQNYYDPWHTKIPLKVELIEVLKGENINLKDNIIYISEYIPEVDKEYILLITPLDNDVYSVFNSGYGTFTFKVEKGEEVITNVVSNKQYKLKDILEY